MREQVSSRRNRRAEAGAYVRTVIERPDWMLATNRVVREALLELREPAICSGAVGRRADDFTHVVIVCGARQSEVGDPYSATAVERDVRRL